MRLSSIAVSAGTAVALVATTTSGAVAHPRHHPAPTPRPWTTVASGLDNPRHLSWEDDALYVAEAGRGGDGPCAEGPEGSACLGLSGAVTQVKVRHHGKGHRGHGKHRGSKGSHTSWTQSRVLTGLPSFAGPGGNEAAGPTDVEVDGKHYAVSMNLGGTPEVRDAFGDDAALMGTLVTGKLKKHGRAKGPWVLADLAAFEAAENPDGTLVDSNPGGLVPTRHGFVVTDAGGNDLLKVDRRGRVSVLATFGTRTVPGPDGNDVEMEPVPTSVAVGPDGAYYVSQLTGFPFPAGGSTIWRVVPGKAPKPYATGLTTVTDLAWHRGQLYVVQLTDGGFFAVDPEVGFEGSLRKVHRNGRTTVVASGLSSPYGVAFRGDAAYVTTCSVCAGGGEVVKVPLR